MSQNNSAFKDWKEIRRKRALELKQQGWKQCQIAAALGVTAAAVSQWVNSACANAEAWRAKPQGHRPPKLKTKSYVGSLICCPTEQKHTGFAGSFGPVHV